MYINLFLSPEDLRKIELIYTSYLPKDGERITEIETDSVLRFCLDKVHDQLISRMEKAKEGCLCN